MLVQRVVVLILLDVLHQLSLLALQSWSQLAMHILKQVTQVWLWFISGPVQSLFELVAHSSMQTLLSLCIPQTPLQEIVAEADGGVILPLPLLHNAHVLVASLVVTGAVRS